MILQQLELLPEPPIANALFALSLLLEQMMQCHLLSDKSQNQVREQHVVFVGPQLRLPRGLTQAMSISDLRSNSSSQAS